MALVEVPQLSDIEIGQHIAVHDDERVVNPGRQRGKANSTRSIERLGFNGVMKENPSANTIGIRVDKGIGSIAQRKDSFSHAV
ncbi:unannotated protein [freshwater metagenome]|uniref:Unannotated protein n=1 Tax=freshwater metagenome TaxID=449393 RepID=A0A6J6PFZ0_9ZZZZ